jgi:hypothetical protein
MASGSGLTSVIRQELAGQPLPEQRNLLLAELSGMLRSGGFMHRIGDGPLDIGVTTTDAAVARRAFRIGKQLTGRAPEVATRWSPPAGQTFRVLVPGADALAGDQDLLATPRWVTDGRRPALAAFLRGALLLRGSISNPSSGIHAEIGMANPALTDDLAGAMSRAWDVHVHADRSRSRVVLKSGEAVGALLVEVGATQAFLTFDAERLSRELRQRATRLANADAANVRRVTDAAHRQLEAIRRVLGSDAWDDLDEERQDTALARLANPDLSLAEIGALLDPPVGKATVHRRLEHVERLLDESA